MLGKDGEDQGSGVSIDDLGGYDSRVGISSCVVLLYDL